MNPKSWKSSSAGASYTGFSCARLLFIANFDRFGSTDDRLLFDDCGELIGAGSKAGSTVRGDLRLWSDWYEVVMAVVAVGPLAIGVRYSVWESGSSLRLALDGFVEGIQGPCWAFAFALACASSANLDGRPFVCELVGDDGFDGVACNGGCDCICEGSDGDFVDDRGIV